MPFLGKFFNQNSDDFGINIDLIFAVFGIDFNQNSDDFGTIIIHLIYAVLRELCLAPERGAFFVVFFFNFFS